MLKKIGIGFLILLVIGAVAGFVIKDRMEKEFEQFMMKEIERKAEEEVKSLEGELEASIDLPDDEEILSEVEDEANTLVDENSEVDADSDKKEPDTTKSENPSEPAQPENSSEPEDSHATETGKTEEVVAKEEVELENPEDAGDKEIPESEELEKPVEAEENSEIVEVSEEISEETYKSDKNKAMALALKRLSLDQIKRLMEISKDGFTAEEKAEAKEMFYNNFTKEEQEWIMSIYESYYVKE